MSREKSQRPCFLRGIFTALAKVFQSLVHFSIAFALLCAPQWTPQAQSDEERGNTGRRVPITFLHTNDLHSHFRADRDELGLGGVARLKTAIDSIRSKTPNTLLVDGGDWSEGEIYFTAGAGEQCMVMMDHLGYDVAVLGNHDWFSGPDALLDAFQNARPRMKLISANLEVSEYFRKEEFNQAVPPYVFKDVEGVRIAFIGASTFEVIYDRFFAPVKVLTPFPAIKKLSQELKTKADLVVVVSHNKIQMNEALLREAPDVDLLISGHQHVPLRKPILVRRDGAPDAWLVEAGYWGRYLGKLGLEVEIGKKYEDSRVHFKNYELIPIDSSFSEDQRTLRMLERLERQIEDTIGEPMFHDHAGHSHVELSYSAAEDYMGNLVTDAYVNATGADFALEHLKFIYQEIHPGTIHSADIFDALAPIYDAKTGKTWTLKTMPMEGRRLKWYMNVLYSTKVFMDEHMRHSNTVAASGIEFTFDPFFGRGPLKTAGGELPFPRIQPPPGLLPGFMPELPSPRALSIGIIRDLKVQGEPLDEKRTYRVAVTNGIIYSGEFINKIFPGALPIKDVVDTGVEAWRELRREIQRISPITRDSVKIGNRMRSLEPNLGVYAADIEFHPYSKTKSSMRGKIKVRVRNFGERPSPETARLRFFANRHRGDLKSEPHWEEIAVSRPLGTLEHGEEIWKSIDLKLPGSQGFYPVKVEITGSPRESDRSNDTVIRWLR